MQYQHNPPTLAEIREAGRLERRSRKEVRKDFAPLEKFALKVTHGVGSIGFFFILAFWTIGWIVWNIQAPLHMRFDPAPAFVVWLIVSNVLQLTLLPLIMVGQNLESKFAERRAQEDFEINKKAEQEIEVVIAHLENQNELLLEILRKAGR